MYIASNKKVRGKSHIKHFPLEPTSDLWLSQPFSVTWCFLISETTSVMQCLILSLKIDKFRLRVVCGLRTRTFLAWN